MIAAIAPTEITTPRLRLEPVRSGHAAAMFPGLSDLRGYGFIPGGPPESVTELGARYARLASGKSPDGQALWLNWMIKRREEADFAGYVQATVLCDEAAVVIAYHVFPDLWGRGLAREAVAGMLAHCRSAYRLREARAYIDTRNARSLHLVEALGLSRIALLPEADFFNGTVSDEYFYRLVWPRDTAVNLG
jgi:[ribosomal protein S5]-alanine N-acetyltransferase